MIGAFCSMRSFCRPLQPLSIIATSFAKKIRFQALLGFVFIFQVGCVEMQSSGAFAEKSSRNLEELHTPNSDDNSIGLGLGNGSALQKRAAQDDLYPQSLLKGKHYQICQDIEAGLEKLGGLPERYCGVPLERFGSEFSEIGWEQLDPSENMDIVKEVVALRRLSSEGGRLRESARLGPSNKDRALIDEAWSVMQEITESAIRANYFSLQRSKFDISNSGSQEIVYRFERKSDNYTCTSLADEDSAGLWSYHVLSRDNHFLSRQSAASTLGPGDFIFYRGRPFLLNHMRHGLAVIETNAVKSRGTFYQLGVCVFRSSQFSDSRKE